jgi:nitrite reductase/ring-hydroxylating ferredoxin subunit
MQFAAKVSEVPTFGKKLVEINGQQILLINQKGTIHAVENECPHQGSPMLAGIVKDDYISCPRHGYRFQLATGLCQAMPDFVLKVYPVTILGEDILVDI